MSNEQESEQTTSNSFLSVCARGWRRLKQSALSGEQRLSAALDRNLTPARKAPIGLALWLAAHGFLGGALAVGEEDHRALRVGIGVCAGVVVWGLGSFWMSKVGFRWKTASAASRIQQLFLLLAVAASLLGAGGAVMRCAHMCSFPPSVEELQYYGRTIVAILLIGALTTVFYRANGLASKIPDITVAATVRVQVWGYFGACAALALLFLVRPPHVDISNPLISGGIGGVSFGAIALAVRASEAVAHWPPTSR